MTRIERQDSGSVRQLTVCQQNFFPLPEKRFHDNSQRCKSTPNILRSLISASNSYINKICWVSSSEALFSILFQLFALLCSLYIIKAMTIFLKKKKRREKQGKSKSSERERVHPFSGSTAKSMNIIIVEKQEKFNFNSLLLTPGKATHSVNPQFIRIESTSMNACRISP